MLGVWSFSEVGGHRHNEDAYTVRPHPLDPGLIVVFVADGQGGRAGGGRAARLACEVGIDVAAGAKPDRLGDPHTWADVIRDIDRAVESDAEAGFTTVVGLCAAAGRIVGASSGDSAALLVTGDKTVELTRAQRKNPPVGSGTAGAIGFDTTALPPWRLLVMTDGVWKYVGWPRVIDIARRATGDAALAEMQQAARLPGSGQFQDDFTVALIESDGSCSTRGS